MSWRAWQGGDLFCLVLSGLISIRCSCWHHLTSFWRCLKLWNSKFTMIMIPVKVAVRNVYSTHCLSHTGIILVLYIPLLLLIIFRLPAMLESVVWFPREVPHDLGSRCVFFAGSEDPANFSASGNVAGRAVENIQVCLSLCWYLPFFAVCHRSILNSHVGSLLENNAIHWNPVLCVVWPLHYFALFSNQSLLGEPCHKGLVCLACPDARWHLISPRPRMTNIERNWRTCLVLLRDKWCMCLPVPRCHALKRSTQESALVKAHCQDHAVMYVLSMQ